MNNAPQNASKEILSVTQGLCSVCRKPVKAYYVADDGGVFFVKDCPEHGEETTKVAGSRQQYEDWTQAKIINIPPKRPLVKGDRDDASCPLHCGTCDNHLQTACCVVVDVTDRCNQHCPYCFAVSGEDRGNEPTLAELASQYDFLLELGEERTFNLQISGGEPTVRDDLPQIVELARDKGFEYIQLNTNGKRIAMEPGYALMLRQAGVSVVFLQFDGTNDEIYLALRDEPLWETKQKAISNCREAGLPVALVPTVVSGVNDGQMGQIIGFLLDNIDIVKGVHFQPVSYFGRHPGQENRVTMFDVIDQICEKDPRFARRDFAPITSGHPLCCFYGTFLKEGNRITSLLSDKKKEEGISCCDTENGGCCGPDALEVIRRDRDFVLNKWNPATDDCNSDCGCGCGSESAASPTMNHETEDDGESDLMDFDRFLTHCKQNTFTLSGMAFQDIKNMDGERLKRCRVQVLTRDNRLIPFCAYNGLYRGEETC
jgi:hypothetical protein